MEILVSLVFVIVGFVLVPMLVGSLFFAAVLLLGMVSLAGMDLLHIWLLGLIIVVLKNLLGNSKSRR